MTFESQPVTYDGAWPELYKAEAQRLLAALMGLSLTIEHIGSTAIAGLTAKPILDVLIELESGALDRLAQPLGSLGYEAKGEYGIPGRAYFSKT